MSQGHQAGWSVSLMAWSLLALAWAALPVPAAAEPCKLGHIGDLPVTMRGMQPLVHAAINGTDTVFLADSGAYFSVLTPAAARQFNLTLEPAAETTGFGGRTPSWVTRVKTFTIFNIDVNNVSFLVGGNDLGYDVVGALGQNVLRIGDVDYDLANGMIRLFRPEGGCRKTSLAYWAKEVPYSEIEIDFPSARRPNIEGHAFLNGSKIRVLFDTGASTSLLTLAAAKRAGVTPKSEGVEPAGAIQGFGSHPVPNWIARFASFKIGDEEIQHPRLRFSEEQVADADMLIGADFFLSHHVYVAASQGTLYFTYNGGPVFNLTTQAWRPPTTAPATAQASGAPADTQPAAPPPPSAAAAQPAAPGQLDAAGYARRGSASASRHDYEHALADLTRAIELAPAEPDYFYQRASAYWTDRQMDKALADLDQALKLKPDHVDALVARARLRILRHDPAEAINADLDAANRAAPKDSAVRFALGDLYMAERNYPWAIAQFDDWIDAHNRNDIRMASARNLRCWVRTLTGRDLDRALADCNFAVSSNAKEAAYHDSRGLVYLRQGRYDKAVADYDAALAVNPKMAWSLYGRGLAKQHLGQTAAGDADIAAAKALAPKIAEEAASHGIGP
jgi:tetratricopeptide (TPR) repeat protein/predicted aspartyl protease